MTTKKKTNKPAHEVRVGRIVAAVWENDTDQGRRHNVTLSRIYKRPNGDEWQRSESFGRDDLPIVEKVCDLAFRWIHERGGSVGESGSSGRMMT